MLDITTIVIIVTFLAAVIDKVVNKPVSERKGIWKRLKSENITILFLGVLLIFQLAENKINSKKEALIEKKTNETHENMLTTKEKVDKANLLIDSVLLNLEKEIQYTISELDQLSTLNDEMQEARKDISKSIEEYQELNSKYSEQLKIERKKVVNAQPDVRVYLPKSTEDSVYLKYQFQLINSGERIADSVEFYSSMILIDKVNFKIQGISPLKTNIGVQNILSLPPSQGITQVANGYICLREEAESYGLGILLVKYSYYDFMIGKRISKPLQSFKSNSINEINVQYGNNVNSQIIERIRNQLKDMNRSQYELFFGSENAPNNG